MFAGKVTVTATAQALGSQNISSSLMLRAKSDNTGDVYVGDAYVNSASGFVLEKGDSIVFESVSNLANVYVVGTLNDIVSWIILNP